MALDPWGTARNLSTEQFHQLPMFAPAHTLKDGGIGRHNPGDLHESTFDEGGLYVERLEHPHEMWDRKLEDSHGSGVHELVGREGVRRPVRLNAGLPADPTKPPSARHLSQPIERGTIMDGHHRIASAHDIDPHTEVPITWSEERRWGSSPGSRSGSTYGDYNTWGGSSS